MHSFNSRIEKLERELGVDKHAELMAIQAANRRMMDELAASLTPDELDAIVQKMADRNRGTPCGVRGNAHG